MQCLSDRSNHCFKVYQFENNYRVTLSVGCDSDETRHT